MRHILRLRELRAPTSGATSARTPPGSDALIVPLAELRADAGSLPRGTARWACGWRRPTASRISRRSCRACAWWPCEFPSPGDGRGYTQGRLLRQRYGFTGELRAVGAGVRQDLVFLLARCGFDAFELAAGEDWPRPSRACARFDVAYQPACRRRRRSALHRAR